MEPTPGRIVLYALKLDDLVRFLRDTPGARHRGVETAGELVTLPSELYGNVSVEWAGNPLRIGDQYPLVIVRPWNAPGGYAPGVSVLNGQVLLDGPGSLWALSVPEGEGPGTWHWPVIAAPAMPVPAPAPAAEVAPAPVEVPAAIEPAPAAVAPTAPEAPPVEALPTT